MLSDEPREVRNQRRRARIKRRDQLAFITKVLGDPNGREWFYDLLSTCHQFSTSFDPNALKMSFREGERNVGLRIVADIIEASSDLYLLMLKEANSERNSSNRNDTDLDDAGDYADPDA